ncbi:MAG: 2-hydroxyacid dehydrogenase [Burkholderiaceae bacterium]
MDAQRCLKAFLCRRFTAPVEAQLRQKFALEVNHGDAVMTPAQIVAWAQGADVLFVTATEAITAEVIHALQPHLKIIATLSVGFDHIDRAAARDCGVKVLHTPDVLSEACAEVALLLMLNACRRGFEADRMVRSGAWPGWGPTQLLGLGLTGRRLGIFGMGRIGRAVATRAWAFGMEIHYHNRSRLAPELDGAAVYHASVDSLLAVSDVFLIAAPGQPELKGFVNRDRIAQMPPRSVVVNISRGDLVDDDALIDALQSGHLFAAGLDVFVNEPRIDARYRTLDNVFLTPHIGSATHETRDAMGLLLIQSIAALAAGETPANLLS